MATLAPMQISSALVSYLFGGSSSSDTLLAIAQGRTGASAAAPQRDLLAVLKDAEKNGAAQIAAKGREPQIKREVDDLIKGVLKAKTVDELLADPKAMKVLLTAAGLEEFVSARGLVAKALKSDPADPNSLAVRLASTNGAWLSAARTYKFATQGLAVVRDPDTLATIAQSYAEVRWREGLDASAPGVSSALTFKAMAATLTSPYQVLGNAVARDVVTTTLGLPKQLAYQPLETQARAITDRLDLTRLKKPAFVDAFVRRYLVALNSGGGLTA
jgi:hypothetical protein